MRKIVRFVIFSVIAFFSNLYFDVAYGQDARVSTFYGTVLERQIATIKNARSPLFIIGFFFVLLLSIFSLKRRGKAKITFMHNGKKLTKLCKIIFSDKQKVILQDSQKTYKCNPQDILQIQKKNTPFIILITVLILLALLYGAYGLIDYMTQPQNNTFSDTLIDTLRP